jgi:hypothetical protein
MQYWIHYDTCSLTGTKYYCLSGNRTRRMIERTNGEKEYFINDFRL